MCLPQIRVVYIRIYITIISICSHYTILTTSLVKPGVGKSPDLGILNVTFKYMLIWYPEQLGDLQVGQWPTPSNPYHITTLVGFKKLENKKTVRETL